MAAPRRRRADAGGGGREARDHAADGSAGTGSPDPGSGPVVPVDGAGSRESDRDKLGAHKGDHNGAGGSVAECEGPFRDAVRGGAAAADSSPPPGH